MCDAGSSGWQNEAEMAGTDAKSCHFGAGRSLSNKREKQGLIGDRKIWFKSCETPRGLVFIAKTSRRLKSHSVSFWPKNVDIANGSFSTIFDKRTLKL